MVDLIGTIFISFLPISYISYSVLGLYGSKLQG